MSSGIFRLLFYLVFLFLTFIITKISVLVASTELLNNILLLGLKKGMQMAEKIELNVDERMVTEEKVQFYGTGHSPVHLLGIM
jgi:hypothetical protein